MHTGAFTDQLEHTALLASGGTVSESLPQHHIFVCRLCLQSSSGSWSG